jgi:hypothetical protein
MREAELMARDGWSREDLLAFQQERVRALVAHAVSNAITGNRWVPMLLSGRYRSCRRYRKPR